MILFSLPDIEITNLSIKDGLTKTILNKIMLELKYFLFIMPKGDYIVITSSIFFESREFMKLLIPDFPVCIENQLIRLLTNQPDMKTLIASEQEGHVSVKNIDRFKEAYYKIDKKIMNINIAFQHRSVNRVGEQSLEKCLNYLNTLPKSRELSCFISRIKDSAKKVFLWPLVEHDMEKSQITESILNKTEFRIKMSESYLETLSTGNLIIPSDEGLSNYPIASNEKVYNPWRLEQLLEGLEIKHKIALAKESNLLKWRENREIRSLCTDIREGLQKFDNIEVVVNKLENKHSNILIHLRKNGLNDIIKQWGLINIVGIEKKGGANMGDIIKQAGIVNLAKIAKPQYASTINNIENDDELFKILEEISQLKNELNTMKMNKKLEEDIKNLSEAEKCYKKNDISNGDALLKKITRKTIETAEALGLGILVKYFAMLLGI